MDRGQLLTIAGVTAVLFAILLYNQFAAARARGRARAPGGSAASGPGAARPAGGEGVPPVDSLLCKFARHGGDVVGETVAIDGERLILKQSGEFKAVPLAQAAEADGEVVLTGSVDWEKARADGKAWHQSRRKADDAVAGQLTRSQDVKSPALDAFRKREGGPGEPGA